MIATKTRFIEKKAEEKQKWRKREEERDNELYPLAKIVIARDRS